MNQEHLENLLREKSPTEKPRPGFETRIQALAREPREPRKATFNFAWLALPGLAAVVITLIMLRTAPAKAPPLVSIPTVQPSKVTQAVAESPMHREVDGLKNDTRRVLALFQRQVPSIKER